MVVGEEDGGGPGEQAVARAVGGRQGRSAHAAVTQIAQQIQPRGGVLAVAVADHQPPAVAGAVVGVGLEVGAPLGLQGGRDHLARRQPAQLVQIQAVKQRPESLRRAPYTATC
jgi:hypothetical protein